MNHKETHMIQAAIFDLDGTLSFTLDSIARSGNSALTAIGLKPFEADAYKYFCGDGPNELVRRMLRASGDTDCTRYDELRPLYGKFFAEYADYKVAPYEGMPEALKALKAKGIRLAVLSNKPHPQTVQVVEKLYGKGLFDMIQGQCAEIARKPAPDGAFLIAEKLGVSPDDCLYVGDTGTDMQTGNSAGMHTVGALWGYRTREELTENHAEMFADMPLDILDLAILKAD